MHHGPSKKKKKKKKKKKNENHNHGTFFIQQIFSSCTKEYA